jgi:hypothetical protein
MIDQSAEKHGQKRAGQGQQIVVGDGGSPESSQPIAGHTNDARGEKISLQGGPEMLRRPPPHGCVNRERWAIHPIGSAQHTGTEAAYHEPKTTLTFQLQLRAADQKVDCERDDNHSQRAFDHSLMTTGQKQKTQRDSKKGGEYEPASATQVDIFPVLHNNDAGDRDRHQHGEWGGDAEGNEEGKQRNGNERFAKAKGGSNQGGDK